MSSRHSQEAPAPRLPEIDAPPEDTPLAPLFGRVRIRTLIVLRWLAVAGQTLSVLIVHYGLGFELPLIPCLLVIAASACLNLTLAFATDDIQLVGTESPTRLRSSTWSTPFSAGSVRSTSSATTPPLRRTAIRSGRRRWPTGTAVTRSTSVARSCWRGPACLDDRPQSRRVHVRLVDRGAYLGAYETMKAAQLETGEHARCRACQYRRRGLHHRPWVGPTEIRQPSTLITPRIPRL
jgi:hypothetical protein